MQWGVEFPRGLRDILIYSAGHAKYKYAGVGRNLCTLEMIPGKAPNAMT